MSRTVAECVLGEVYAGDEEMATFLDIAVTVLHSRSILRTGGECDAKPTIDEMNRVLDELSDHPVEASCTPPPDTEWPRSVRSFIRCHEHVD